MLRNTPRRGLQLEKNNRHVQVAAWLGALEVDKMDALIKAGAYMNRSDFVRYAVREKLESVEVLEPRQVARAGAREEILAHLRRQGISYASDISRSLRLDLDLVLSILEELRKAQVLA